MQRDTFLYCNDPTLPTGNAINVDDSSRINITRNSIISNLDKSVVPLIGINLDATFLNVSENNLSGFGVGINAISMSNGNSTISWNRVSRCYTGISVFVGYTVFANTIFGNTSNGIYVEFSDNRIFGNYVQGIDNGMVVRSSNNSIYGNNFVDNSRQVIVDPMGEGDDFNFWDNGVVGNYWSDFAAKYPNATEVDSTGTWSTPYAIDANNNDHHPLLNPISAEQAIQLAPPQSTPQPTSTPNPSTSPTLEPSLTPTPTSNGTQAVDWTPMVLAAVVVVAVAVAALVYFWRRKP